MKNTTKTILAILFLFSQSTYAQFVNFDEFSLDSSGYWNGCDLSGNIVKSPFTLSNSYDTAWGGFWANGFAFSNHSDTLTAGYTNQYSCFSGNGANSTSVFGIIYSNAYIKINQPTSYLEFYVNNSTYAALSMKNGDFFGKKFGDSTNASGQIDSTNGNDWFKITMKLFLNGTVVDSQFHYLADYRFNNDSLDYIQKNWEKVTLSNITFDSIAFFLSSSDNGIYGMNTPAYFCIDQINLTNPNSINKHISNNISLQIYPNPALNYIKVKSDVKIINLHIYNNLNSVVKSINVDNSIIDVTSLPNGMYTIKALGSDNNVYVSKFIKI